MKISGFLANQILREINFGHFEAPITCRLDHFCSSEFWIFGNLWHFQVGNFQNSKPAKLLKLARVAGIILSTLLVHKTFDNYFVKWSQCSKYKQAFENCNRYMYIHLYSVKIVELNFVWFEEKIIIWICDTVPTSVFQNTMVNSNFNKTFWSNWKYFPGNWKDGTLAFWTFMPIKTIFFLFCY